MKTLARSMISMVMMTGLFTAAFAQTPAKPAAPTPPPAPAAKQPVAVKPVAPTAAPTAAKAAPTAAKAETKPAEPMAMPAAPAEVAAMAKTAGALRCTGSTFGPMGEVKMVATVRNKLDLDKWWIRTSFAQTGGMKFKFEAFTTYDPAAKNWTRVMVDNFGSHEVSTSDGVKDNKIVWEGTSKSAMGAMAGRHYEDMTNPKETKMWGEYSMDKGKTYQKAYDMSCKR
jgi:glucose/arabinose dehydrogenase